MNAVATMATPCGPFTVVVAPGNVVVASGWTSDPGQLATGSEWAWRCDHGPITAAVDAYFGGQLDAIVGVVVRQRSGPFSHRVWEALRAVPPGAPVTYQELAARAGHPGAARAAGTACGRNAAALFVPCHRAQRGDRGLGGFAWGLAVKRWLLDYEAGGPSDGELAGGGVVGVEAAVDHVLHREDPR